MKRLLTILICVFIFMLQAGDAAAHPPVKIVLDFDQETSILKVAVLHEVKDAVKHFVEKIEVKLNDKEILNQEFLSQLDKENQTAMYVIHDAKSGDRLEVSAYCNVFGKMKEIFQIP